MSLEEKFRRPGFAMIPGIIRCMTALYSISTPGIIGYGMSRGHSLQFPIGYSIAFGSAPLAASAITLTDHKPIDAAAMAGLISALELVSFGIGYMIGSSSQ